MLGDSWLMAVTAGWRQPRTGSAAVGRLGSVDAVERPPGHDGLPGPTLDDGLELHSASPAGSCRVVGAAGA